MPGYMEAMGITIVQGRGFTAADREDSVPVAIVNETMAQRYWPGLSPVGRRVRFNGDGGVWMEVVGVVADVKHWGLDAPVNPELYQPLSQPLAFSSTMTFVVPAAGDPAALGAALRQQVRAVDPNLPVSTIRTMEEVAAVSVGTRRVGLLLVAVFGGLALVLAAAGIHGVMSHLVVLRTMEIGVRMTLGAAPRSVLALFLREGAIQACVGLAIGLSGGVLLMRTFGTILYGVEPADPLTLVTAGVVLLATALAACALPARRAMRVDPVAALRT
jgi:predicted permease